MSLTKLFTLSPEWQDMLVRFVILLCVSIFITWLYSVIRLYFTKGSNDPLKVRMYCSLIEGALAGILVLGCMMFALVYVTGWRRFVWDEWSWSFSNTYIMLLPEILTFVFLSVFFIVQRNYLLNVLKTK